ncbi:hypothetical protein JCM15519_16750 [Fundidesulfovibrio butyratiphilus]
MTRTPTKCIHLLYMDTSSVIIWAIIIIFGSIGFICISEHYFLGEVIGFGVAALAFWFGNKTVL